MCRGRVCLIESLLLLTIVDFFSFSSDMDLPVLSSVMGIRSSIAHEKIFVVVRCGTSDSEPQLGQALVSLQSILEHDEWSLNVPLSKFGVVVGRLVGRIVVSCLE